ncbi:MAG: hydroxyisourate hydrolase [Steroidobacteraceae bacterium]
MGSLTTHVLDMSRGGPAAGVRITLRRITGGAAATLLETVTNSDGRCDAPLLCGECFIAGQYEIAFGVGRYFGKESSAAESPAFLTDVIVRFGVAHPEQHYHVPLLVSPYGYTTYRGS